MLFAALPRVVFLCSCVVDFVFLVDRSQCAIRSNKRFVLLFQPNIFGGEGSDAWRHLFDSIRNAENGSAVDLLNIQTSILSDAPLFAGLVSIVLPRHNVGG